MLLDHPSPVIPSTRIFQESENYIGRDSGGYKGYGGTRNRQNLQEMTGTWAQDKGGKGGTNICGTWWKI